MAVSFPSNADSAQLATDGYSEVILLTDHADIGNTFSATGGDSDFTYSGKSYHEFLSDGTLTFSSGGTFDVLLVGGGGGGGDNNAGGGAGGEVVIGTGLTLSSGGTITVTVGDGGAGATADTALGINGGASSIAATGLTTITAKSGQGGESRKATVSNDDTGSNSGGAADGFEANDGTASTGNSASSYSSENGGSYTVHGGNTGGNGSNGVVSPNFRGGGGGAGAGGDGESQTATEDGDGGVGVQVTGWGPTDYYYGGGGGSSNYQIQGGDGGIGGGGGGSASGGGAAAVGIGGGSARNSGADGTGTSTSSAGGAGGDNTGGGGGAGAYTIGNGGAGGSGIVVIRYTPTSPPLPSTTFTIPAGVDSVSIVAIGPGGGSGGSNGTNAGGGGGGGGLSWINSVAVSEGSTITLTGGTRGIGGDSGGANGDSGTASTVSLSYLGPISYSGVDINPFNDVLLTGDSATGILTARSNRGTDSDVVSSFGQLDSLSLGSINTLFDVYNNSVNFFNLDFNINGTTSFDSSALPLSYPSWSGAGTKSGGMADSDAYPGTYLGSSYDNEDVVLGTLDSISIGSGRLTVFGVFTNSIGTALQSTITNSPYIDSNGNSTVGATDPNDVRGYGPGGDELKQVIIRSRAGDTIAPV